MIKKHTKFPSIEQLRSTIFSVNRQATYVGRDENDEPIYDETLPKPVISFEGTVKLHGTNASICFNDDFGLWAQSNDQIITVKEDNATFAFFVESNKDIIMDLIKEAADKYHIDTKSHTIAIYGEWAGQRIHKGVAINKIPKALFIFGLKVARPGDPEFKSYWLDSSGLKREQCRIFNIHDYKKFQIDIDFNDPQVAADKITEMVEDVERQCPVAMTFGIEGVGEGIVFIGEYEGISYRFKAKGEKHKISETKVLTPIDVEKMNSIQEFAAYAVTRNRVEQGISKVYGDASPDMSKVGDLMRWMIGDILKEELDVLKANKLEPKEINKAVSDSTRKIYFEILDELAFKRTA